MRIRRKVAVAAVVFASALIGMTGVASATVTGTECRAGGGSVASQSGGLTCLGGLYDGERILGF